MAAPIQQDSFDLVIVSPDEIIYEGSVTKMIAPGYIQDIAILPNHTPLYSQLNQGIITITPTSGTPQTIPIDGGILRVKQNRASIIVGFDVLKH